MKSVEQRQLSTTFLKAITLAMCALVLTLSGGCATKITGGKQFDINKVSEIENGKTTKNDILSMFGPPYSKSQGSGFEQWMYQYSELRSGMFEGYKMVLGGGASVDQSMQSLTISFKGDIVQDYSSQVMGQ